MKPAECRHQTAWEKIAGETGDWVVSLETYDLYLAGLAERQKRVVALLSEYGVVVARIDTDKRPPGWVS
jgi:hypothetical protein